jgi:hypothetical protein
MSTRCHCAKPLAFVQVKVVSRPNKVTKVLVRFAGTSCCEVGVDNYLKTMSEVYDKQQPFVVIYDATEVGRIPLTLINKQAAFMRKYDHVTKEYLVRCAVVLTSEWARSSLKMLFTLKPPACPLRTFATIDEGKEWLKVVT